MSVRKPPTRAPERLIGQVLVVDDDEGYRSLIQIALERAGHTVTTASSAHEALERVATSAFDVVLTDIVMAEMDGVALCERVRAEHADLPVVMMTGQGTRELAIASLRAHAYDFLTKPITDGLLVAAIERAMRWRLLRREVRRLRREAEGTTPIPGLIGTSEAMRQVYDLVSRVSSGEASVLIQGETGTGKEIVARAIHERSPRAGKPFVAINCAAIPPTLIESELFGHARGAFTDAKTERAGLFVEANHGTIFLDEIGELPVELQPKLLRVLQEHKVRPVGSNVEMSFDARVITATHRDLEADVAARVFREDLFYRINVVTIAVPPLRARGTDVLAIAQHILRSRVSDDRKISISPPVAEALLAYAWPGNVRELENCMEHALALARFDQITVEDLPEKLLRREPKKHVVDASDSTEMISIDELEMRYIHRVMEIFGGNKSRAARVLGLDRRTLYRKLDRVAQDNRVPHEETREPSEPEPETAAPLEGS